MRLTPYGVIVREEWLKTAALRPDVDLDAYVIIPNHFHAAIFILQDDDARDIRPETDNGPPRRGAPMCAPTSLASHIFMGDALHAGYTMNMAYNTPSKPITARQKTGIRGISPSLSIARPNMKKTTG